MNVYKHLTLGERIIIQSEITSGKSLSYIARELKKSVSTITKEVKKHLTIKKTNGMLRRYNPCALAKTCRKKRVCPYECNRLCSTCGKCIEHCSDFEYYECPKLKHSPYCCNACNSKCVCSLLKKYYYAENANNEYKQLLTETRKGYCITEEEALSISEYLESLVKQGQSIHNICESHKDEMPFCEKTIYTYIDAGVFNLKNIDLPRKVRYKLRKKPLEHKVDSKCRIGRTYEDYQRFMKENDNPAVVQIDSVKGDKSGKVLLTIHFVTCSFMLAYLREENTSKTVIEVFDYLYKRLGEKVFKKLFPVILTDNGTEFSNPIEIEFDKDTGERRTYVFYCDTRRSDQKGSIEVNHEFIRRISPSGKSFDNRTQEEINLMMSHINSYGRKKLNEKTPYEVFNEIYGEVITSALGIRRIPNDEVNLTPRLFGKR